MFILEMDASDDEVFDQIACISALIVEDYSLKYIRKQPCMNSMQTGNMWLKELLEGNDNWCHMMFRMENVVFFKLYADLKTNYGLKGSRRVGVAEILGMFLHNLGHGVGNRLA